MVIQLLAQVPSAFLHAAIGTILNSRGQVTSLLCSKPSTGFSSPSERRPESRERPPWRCAWWPWLAPDPSCLSATAPSGSGHRTACWCSDKLARTLPPLHWLFLFLGDPAQRTVQLAPALPVGLCSPVLTGGASQTTLYRNPAPCSFPPLHSRPPVPALFSSVAPRTSGCAFPRCLVYCLCPLWSVSS